MTLNPQSLASVLRQISAVAAIVLGAIPQTHLGAAAKVPLIAIGGVLLAIEHFVSDPTTGTGAPPPKSGTSVSNPGAPPS